MIKIASVSFANKDQKLKQRYQKELQNFQQGLSLKAHYPFFVPPREAKRTPTANNIAEKNIETSDVLRFISSLTKGCITAKTRKATPKLINPLPSSFNPLNKSIEPF